jgi:SAM-dependent methyltransferase
MPEIRQMSMNFRAAAMPRIVVKLFDFSGHRVHSIYMFEQRSLALELIDTGDYTPEEYAQFLREIALVNRFAGDYWALERSLFADVKRAGAAEFSVLDLGAGSGELLRMTADFAKKNNYRAKLTGLELNPDAAGAILAESARYENILALQGNALQLPFADRSFDYVMCSLFTHHLPDESIVKVFEEMRRVARRSIHVIDLHRHPLAYFLYTTVGRIFIKGRLVRQDGALSILRAFKPEEMRQLARRAHLKNIEVTRRFPFRLVLKASAND